MSKLDLSAIEATLQHRPAPPAWGENEPPDGEPGAFPVQALSPAMRAMAESVAEVYRVPVELPALCAVAANSGALGGAFKLTEAVDGRESFGNLYVIPAAPKSSGKGSVAGAIVKPLLEASAELETAFRENQLPGLRREKSVLDKRVGVLVNQLAAGKTGAGKDKQAMGEFERKETESELDQAHARLEAIAPLLDALPTYWLGNATSEAMERQFKRNNGGLFCYSPEAGSTVRVMLGKYTKGAAADLDLFLSGYSVEPYRSDRITRGVCQITPCLSLLLMVQPSILRELLTHEEAFERGLTARLIMCIVETEPLEDDGALRRVNARVAAAWNERIHGILNRRETLAGQPRPIQCTDEAREEFRRFHNDSVKLRRGEFRDIEAELGRWRENAIRISVGQCVADNPEARELTGEQAARAVEIMRWCALAGLKITLAGQMRKRAQRADELQTILLQRNARQTLRDLDKCHGFKKDEVCALARQFPDRFTIEREQPTCGRPSEVLHLNLLARA